MLLGFDQHEFLEMESLSAVISQNFVRIQHPENKMSHISKTRLNLDCSNWAYNQHPSWKSQCAEKHGTLILFFRTSQLRW